MASSGDSWQFGARQAAALTVRQPSDSQTFSGIKLNVFHILIDHPIFNIYWVGS